MSDEWLGGRLVDNPPIPPMPEYINKDNIPLIIAFFCLTGLVILILAIGTKNEQ